MSHVAGVRDLPIGSRTRCQLRTSDGRLSVLECLAHAIEEMPAGSIGLGHLRNGDVIHEAEAQDGFALQLGTRATGWKHDYFPWPQRREHPFDHVASRVALAIDLALFIDFVAASGDDLGLERKVSAGDADAIKRDLQVSLAPEVAGIFGGFQVTDEIASAGKGLLAEFSDSAKMAENGIADVNGGCGEIGLIHSALQEGTGGPDKITCAGC